MWIISALILHFRFIQRCANEDACILAQVYIWEYRPTPRNPACEWYALDFNLDGIGCQRIQMQTSAFNRRA
eukprot:2867158-Amphidinium_carterae.1